MAHDTPRHLVVDGSNIATESRTVPSLAQLDEAVRAMMAEQPDWQITVIVDATFGHRIDSKERKAYEEASDNGEIVTPPAGAVGRGDAFILQVAEKAGAAVLSNDSFQEFHGQHPWLFDEDRLIGGKPVEGIGWVFVPRVPVRGPTSRQSTREAEKRASTKSGSTRAKATKRSRRSASATGGPAPKPTADTPPPRPAPASKSKTDSSGGRGSSKKNARSKTDAGANNSAGSQTNNRANKAARSSKTKKVVELNSPIDFLGFVGKHSIGDQVEAVVERFSSHGCYVRSSGAQCYLPLAAMGEPQPSRARDVVSDGQNVIVTVESIDSDRRGINVKLVQAIDADKGSTGQHKSAATRSTRGAVRDKTSQQVGAESDDSAGEVNPTRSETTVATKKTAKKSPAKATASKRATRASARKATKKAAKKAPAKKAAKKAPAKKAAKKTTKKAAKKAPAKKTTKKAVKKTAKKAPAKKAEKKTTKKAAKKATRR
jgi:hypothetical protein